MMKKLGVRIGFLVFVLLTFTNMAHAVGFSNYRLLLQDFQTSTTGVQLAITDNQTSGLLNSYGDKSSTLGDISWSGNVGHFYVSIDATSTDGVSAGGQLTLNANVAYQGVSGGLGEQFVLSLEDQGYAATPGSAVLLQNTVNNLSLTNNASSVTTNTWLTTAAGDVSAFGTNGIHGTNILPVALSVPVIPADASGPVTQTFNSLSAGGITGTDVVLPSTATTTNLLSQATVDFTAGSGGTANFVLTASDAVDTSWGGGNVPEPTTVTLLGAALLGLGIVTRGKKLKSLRF